MATKRNPGKFDCYAKAHDDEPMFIILGRDPAAAAIVNLWIEVRRRMGEGDKEQLGDAEACRDALIAWADKLGKRDKIVRARDALSAVFTDAVMKAASKL